MTTAKLADDAVTTAKIQDASITGAKLASSFSYSGTLTATAFVGDGSGLTNISGGASSLDDLSDVSYSTSSDNLVLGDSAAQSISGSYSNIAIGSNAMQSLAWSENIAIGHSSLQAASGCCGGHIAIGNQSLKSITGGTQNIHIAKTDVSTLRDGNYNILIGNNTDVTTSSTSYAIALGDYAKSGNRSIAIGKTAYATGDSAIAIGSQLGSFATNASGDGSISLGGSAYTTGDHAISIGNRIISQYDGVIALGYGITATASNKIYLGGSNITEVITPGTVTANGTTLSSDRRLKQDIQPIREASNLINALQTYQYQKRRNLSTDDYSNEEFGLIAQEVQEILPFLVYEGGGEDRILSLDYNSFIALLIKAHQEQQALLDEQTNLLTSQKTQIDALQDRLEKLERMILQDE